MLKRYTPDGSPVNHRAGRDPRKLVSCNSDPSQIWFLNAIPIGFLLIHHCSASLDTQFRFQIVICVSHKGSHNVKSIVTEVKNRTSQCIPASYVAEFVGCDGGLLPYAMTA